MINLGKKTTALFLLAILSSVYAGDVPDLLKGKGPDIAKLDNGTYSKETWVLHYHGLRGWMYKDKNGRSDAARQILISAVKEDSLLGDQVQLGDVILGVNGKPFEKLAVFGWRKAARKATADETPLDVIMWRKGWDKPRNVKLTPAKVERDFTKGGKPDFAKGVDWNLGATGARGWMPAKFHDFYNARQIYITSIHKGSPADGILQEGDVILGIGGTPFSSDARKAFAKALTQAETREASGNLNLLRWRPSTELGTGDGPSTSLRTGKTETVTVQLDVLGSYSKTTPWNCEKSQKILDRACGYLIRTGNKHGITHGTSVVRSLALMSTGNKNYLPIVREHIDQILAAVDKSVKEKKGLPSWGYKSWGYGYVTLLLSEYYLLTKDERIFPAVDAYSTAIAEGQSGVGSWGHGFADPNHPVNRGRLHGQLGGYGAVNQAGNVCWISLMLAKRCGVENNEVDRAINRGHTYLNSYVDLMTVGYGDYLVYKTSSHDNNGVNSSTAVGFALYGDKHGTDYFSRMTVASHAVREEGHTGVWFASLWAALGAARSGQEGCSAFLHELAWLHDLERRWDGGFEYQGKPGFGCKIHTEGPNKGQQARNAEHQYAHWDTTGQRIIMYCLPRKVLHITGKELLETAIPSAEVADVIDAGRIEGARNERNSQYDNLSEKELLELLGSWSPVVRNFAASSLAKKPKLPTAEIVKLFDGNNQYAKYGACLALLAAKSKDDVATKAFLKQTASSDLLLQLHAVAALGFINDQRAVAPLLKLAAKDHPNDPRGVISYTLCQSLFSSSPYKTDKGVLAESIAGVDDNLLIPAIKKLLYCPHMGSRSLLAIPVQKLTEAQRNQMWPELVYALKDMAPGGNIRQQSIRLKVGAIMADNHIEEGIGLLADYLKTGGRPEDIAPLLKKYKGSAISVLPQLEEALSNLESKNKPKKEAVDAVRQAIDAIKPPAAEIETESIKRYLQTED